MSEDDQQGEDAEYSCAMPFWIDTDAYTDRDRQMFTAGVEFQMVYQLLKNDWAGERTIHRENESRVRMMCGKMKRKCQIDPCEGHGDTWAFLTVFPEKESNE